MSDKSEFSFIADFRVTSVGDTVVIAFDHVASAEEVLRVKQGESVPQTAKFGACAAQIRDLVARLLETEYHVEAEQAASPHPS